MSIDAVISRRVSRVVGDAGSGQPAPPATVKPANPTSFSAALQSRPASARRAAPQAAATAAPANATSTSSSLPAGTPYGAEITAAANAHGLDPALLAGLVKQESGFNPNAGYRPERAA